MKCGRAFQDIGFYLKGSRAVCFDFLSRHLNLLTAYRSRFMSVFDHSSAFSHENHLLIF